MTSAEPSQPSPRRRSRFRGKIQPKPLEGVSRFLLENEWFWAALFLLVVLLLFSRQFRMEPPPSLPLGSAAPRDIRAPFDLQIQDQVATERRRAEVVAKIPPVYDWDSGKAGAVTASLAGFFEEARARVKEYDLYVKQAGLGSAEKRAAEEQFLERLSESIGGGVSRYGLRLFHREGFSVDLEHTVQELARKVLERKIVPEEERFQGRDVVRIRDIRKSSVEWEQRNPTASDIVDLSEARSQAGPLLEGVLGMPEAMKGAIEEYVRSRITPNLTFNSQETAKRQEAASSDVEPLVVFVKKGQVMVGAGKIVDESALQKISAFQEASRALVNVPLLLSLFLFLLLLLAFTFMYLKTYRKEHCPRLNLFVLFLQVACGFVLVHQGIHLLVAALAEGAKGEVFGRVELYAFLVPVAAGTMLVTLLVDKHVGAIFALFHSVLFGMMMDLDLRFMLFALLSSFTAVFAATKLAQRTAQLRAGLLIGGVNVFLAMAAIARDPIWEGPLQDLLFPLAMAFLGGAVLTPLLVSPLLPLFEGAFGILTEVRLLGLANMNHPLLRRLAMEAPGTFNHSIMMSTLSEAAASAVGANGLFCRVGCYFHDVGKMLNPIYFVENQLPGQNPHDKLAPRISALIVAAHVKEGMAMCRQYAIPEPVVDLIPQHHGSRRVSFFYDKALTMLDPEKGAMDDADFRYPGPKPQSREAAIIMLSDGVEAASRVLREPTHHQIKALIQEITERALGEGQFSECDLTFEDLAKVQEAFFQILVGVFSRRISYPSYRFDKEPKDAAGSRASVPSA